MTVTEASRVLGVHPEASHGVLRAAYLAQTSEWHPDRNPSPEAPLRMTRVNLAYEMLSTMSMEARVFAVNREAQAARQPRKPTKPAGAAKPPRLTNPSRRHSPPLALPALAFFEYLLDALSRVVGFLSLWLFWVLSVRDLWRWTAWYWAVLWVVLSAKLLWRSSIRLVRFGWHDVVTYWYHLF